MPRVALDRNVLISAALSPGGPCAELVEAARAGRMEMVMSPILMDDLTAALTRRLPAEQAGRFLWRVRDAAVLVADPPRAGPADAADPSYAAVVGLARARGLDAVVTGNGRLLRDRAPGLPVVSPRGMLDRLAAARRRDELRASLKRARASRTAQAGRAPVRGLAVEPP